MTDPMPQGSTAQQAPALRVGARFGLSSSQAAETIRWHTFDARNNTPRIGRVVVGRGRDAVDVALITSFGPLTLTGLR